MRFFVIFIAFLPILSHYDQIFCTFSTLFYVFWEFLSRIIYDITELNVT